MFGSAIQQHESAIGIHMSPLLNLPPTSHPIPCHSSRLSQSTGFELPISYIANSHWLSILHMVIYFNAALPVHPTLSFPYCVHKSVLYVCVLQVGSSVPSLYIPYICVNIQYLFSLSDLLHSVRQALGLSTSLNN